MKSSCFTHENYIFISRCEIASVSQQKQHKKKSAFLLCCALSLQEILHNISAAGFLWEPPKQAQEKAQLLHTATAHNRKQESQELNHCLSIALCMLGHGLVEKIGSWEDSITFASLLSGL